MYFLFLWEVLKRAFSPTARITDVLQILAASTIPAIGKFAGIELPSSANNDALAYIGLIAVSFIAIRVLWAPYSLWKEQAGQIGTLKLELSKPERLVLEHIARHRAKARQKMKGALVDLHARTFNSDAEQREPKVALAIHRMERLVYRAGVEYRFLMTMEAFIKICEGRDNDDSPIKMKEFDEFTFISSANDYIDGLITIEALGRLLPAGTAIGKQP